MVGGLLLALAAIKPDQARRVRRYGPYFSAAEWTHVEPVVKQAFEGYW